MSEVAANSAFYTEGYTNALFQSDILTDAHDRYVETTIRLGYLVVVLVCLFLQKAIWYTA